ncbi:MAG: hypothetical protein ACE5G8_09085, partial [Anaerolineae bacterium]
MQKLGVSNLVVAPAAPDVTTPQKLGLLIIALLATLSGCPAPARAPQTLAFASDRSGNGDIFILNRRGRLTNLTDSPTGEWTPRWSPDGTQLAFTGYRAEQADIWLMAADGSNPTNLTDHPAWDYSPAWSPDGTRVVFVSERDGDAELFVQAAGSLRADQLTFNTHQDKLPAWSPQGDQIAFAAVINGVEQIYLLNVTASTTITPLLPPGLNGTGPAWSPGGTDIAFVGWRDDDAVAIYTLNLNTGALQQRYSDTTWLGSLNWSWDGAWLFFAARTEHNHNLMALRLRDGQTFRLTTHPAWDDFPALRPGASFTPPPRTAGAQGARSPTPAPFAKTQFGYGVNLADLSNAYLIQDIGFTAIKGYVNWATVEATPGEFRWVDPDNVLHAAEGAGAAVLLRVHGTPGWARPPDTPLSHPPTNPADFARFLSALSRRYRGRVAAYEIWNEPNLNYEWGNRPPDPAEYAALLKIAYRAIKAEALRDLAFIEGMYRAGAKGNFDALGSHPYAYGRPPDFDDPAGITFGRVAQQRQLMVQYGDAGTPIWITEMGWNLDTHWDLGQYHNRGVSPLEQAQYLRRAY